MKRNITKHSLSVTLTLVSDTVEESNSVSSPYGPWKAGLITSPGTLGVPLTVLLSSLEKSLENLQSKSYTVSDTSNIDTQIVRALRCISTIDTTGTDVIH